MVWYLFAALSLALVWSLSRGLSAARARLAAWQPRQVATRHGAIAVLRQGQGPPMLILHGLFGGYDQGAEVAATGPQEVTRLIPSRFGYPGSDMPADPTPAKQAEALADMLDSEGADRVAVLGASAGAVAALRFARDFPDRCRALILVSPATAGATPTPPIGPRLAGLLMRAELPVWLASRVFPRLQAPILGIPPARDLTAPDRAFVTRVLATLTPSGLRAPGALHDIYAAIPSLAEFPEDDIRCPVLILAARDDPLTWFTGALRLAAALPDARLVRFATGGHLLIGGHERAAREIATFLAALPEPVGGAVSRPPEPPPPGR